MEWWVKLHRRIEDRWRYSEGDTARVFFHLLIRATHKAYNSWWVYLEPWQCIVWRKILADKLKISERAVRTAITRLISTNEITIKTTNRFTVITLVKWEDFQSDDEKTTNASTNRLTNKRPTNDQQTTTIQEQKNKRIITITPSTNQLQSIKQILTDEWLANVWGLDILQEFVDYWWETTKNWKEKRQLQKTWNLELRLKTWKKNKETNFGRMQQRDYSKLENFTRGMKNWKYDEMRQRLWKEKFFEIKGLYINSLASSK